MDVFFGKTLFTEKRQYVDGWKINNIFLFCYLVSLCICLIQTLLIHTARTKEGTHQVINNLFEIFLVLLIVAMKNIKNKSNTQCS